MIAYLLLGYPKPVVISSHIVSFCALCEYPLERSLGTRLPAYCGVRYSVGETTLDGRVQTAQIKNLPFATNLHEQPTDLI